MRATWVIGTVVILCAGCGATGPFKRLEDGAGAPVGEVGVVMFSQLKTDRQDLIWEFAFGPAGAQEHRLVGREFRMPNGFYDLPCGRLGGVWAMAVPPGRYEFGPWFVTGNPGIPLGKMVTGPINAETVAPGVAAVDVVAGEITYIGEIAIDEPSGNRAAVTDRWDCDRQYVVATWPELAPYPLRRQIASFEPRSP